MSKICSICGFECADTVLSCPICGTPFPDIPASIPGQPVTGTAQTASPVQPKTVSPVQTQAAQGQPQTVLPVQTQAVQGQPQAVASEQSQTIYPGQPQTVYSGQPQTAPQYQQTTPIQPQSMTTPQPVSYIQNPGMAGQVPLGMPETPKKSTKTLWIVLGIVGGVILLLMLLALILFFVLHNAGYDHEITGNTPGGTGNRPTDYHEYYYPGYDDASFHSEAFADVTTEAPEAATTEEPVPSGYLNDTEEFRQEDLTLHTVEEDPSATPVTLNFILNQGYTITETGDVLQSGDGSFSAPAEFQNKQAALGRDCTIGSSMDDFAAAYGVDSTNAVWQLAVNDTYEYYYYSTTAKPDPIPYDYTALVLGWYRNGDTWNRMLPQELFQFWQNGSVPECEEMILYVAVSDDDYKVKSVSITYGTADYFRQFITNWQTLSEIMNDTSEE